jgi:hypothetical protein
MRLWTHSRTVRPSGRSLCSDGLPSPYVRLPKGGASAVEILHAGQAPYPGAIACARALPSMAQARLESRFVCLRTEEPHPFVTGCGP